MPEDAAARITNRDGQQQAIVMDNARRRGFTHAQFVAHLKSDMKFTKNGDVEITLVVQHEFKHLAFPLSDAFGLPLSVDVELWRPYTEAQG